MKRLQIAIEDELDEALEEAAKARQLSKTDLVAQYVRERVVSYSVECASMTEELEVNDLESETNDAAIPKSGAASQDSPRPFGLCAGAFTVPEDFDDPLPEEILHAFEGR